MKNMRYFRARKDEIVPKKMGMPIRIEPQSEKTNLIFGRALAAVFSSVCER